MNNLFSDNKKYNFKVKKFIYIYIYIYIKEKEEEKNISQLYYNIIN